MTLDDLVSRLRSAFGAELRSVVTATVQPNHVALWIPDR